MDTAGEHLQMIIMDHINALEAKMRNIQELRDSLRNGGEISPHQYRLLSSLRVERQLNALEGLSGIAPNHLFETLASKIYELQSLESRISELEKSILEGIDLNFNEIEELQDKGQIVHEIQAYKKVLESLYAKMPNDEVMNLLDHCKGFWPIEYPTPDIFDSEKRYLLLSNGYGDIFYLNLYQKHPYNNSYDVPVFPTLNALPVIEDSTFDGGIYPGLSNYRFIALKMGREIATNFPSLGTASLGLVMDPRNNLSYRTSKFWMPIGECIGGLFHIIGVKNWRLDHTAVAELAPYYHRFHPVKTLNEVLWGRISNHMLLGSQLFAVIGEKYEDNQMYLQYLQFNASKFGFDHDTVEGRWQLIEREAEHPNGKVRDVWDIFYLGYGICLGEYKHSSSTVGRLYVLMALQEHAEFSVSGTYMDAYIVTEDGRVVCHQPITGFFRGPVWPLKMDSGTIIKEDNKMKLCSVHTGSTYDGESEDFLFINRFTVDYIVDAASQVQSMWEEEAWPIEHMFMEVKVKDSHVYQTDPLYLGRSPWRHHRPVQASFVEDDYDISADEAKLMLEGWARQEFVTHRKSVLNDGEYLGDVECGGSHIGDLGDSE